MDNQHISNKIIRIQFFRILTICTLYGKTLDNMYMSVNPVTLFNETIAATPSSIEKPLEKEFSNVLLYLEHSGIIELKKTYFRGEPQITDILITGYGIDFAEKIYQRTEASSLSNFRQVTDSTVINYFYTIIGNEHSNISIGDQNTQSS